MQRAHWFLYYVEAGTIWYAFNLMCSMFVRTMAGKSPLHVDKLDKAFLFGVLLGIMSWPLILVFTTANMLGLIPAHVEQKFTSAIRRLILDEKPLVAQMPTAGPVCMAQACVDENWNVLAPGVDDLSKTRSIAYCLLRPDHGGDHSVRKGASSMGHGPDYPPVQVTWPESKSVCMVSQVRVCARARHDDETHADATGYQWTDSPPKLGEPMGPPPGPFAAGFAAMPVDVAENDDVAIDDAIDALLDCQHEHIDRTTLSTTCTTCGAMLLGGKWRIPEGIVRLHRVMGD